jgi:membrane-associated phospholipid phosphatase
MGHLFLSFKSVLLLPLGLFTIAIIGFSRVYSRARFPHQIVGSWLTGLVGLLLSMHCCEKMDIRG